MNAIRTIAGSIAGAILGLILLRVIPYSPDLTDWGGRSFPRAYIEPLVLLFIVGYMSGFLAGQIIPKSGRLAGMLGSIILAVVIIGFDFSSDVVNPLFHHPAYPSFSDQALLALGVLLIGGHLGGFKVEKSALSRPSE